MKKLISLTLALVLALAALAVPAMAQGKKVGVLTYLNATEEQTVPYLSILRTIGRYYAEKATGVSAQDDMFSDFDIVFYDTLDAMLMGLNAGEIDSMITHLMTARYLCSENPELCLPPYLQEMTDDEINEYFVNESAFAHDDFAFMLLEGNEALCEEFNAAIESIKNDDEGTLDQLVWDQIITPISSGLIIPVEMPVFEGEDKIWVAITGALPPMDYIAPDGSAAGFNTALLAEIAERLHKNIELVVVDSIGRAAALASGTVDVVFWTRTKSALEAVSEEGMLMDALDAEMAEGKSTLSDQIEALLSYDEGLNLDRPEGTIVTMPYYSAAIVPVITRASLEG